MLKNIPISEQPREKLMTQGATFLSNSELIAILLRTGTRNKSALEIANMIMKDYEHQMSELCHVTIEELCLIDGIGESKACQLIAALELGKRAKQHTIERKTKIASPNDVIQFFNSELGDLRVEKFIAVFLNTKNEVINWEVISVGSLNASIVHPREVFNRAIKKSASSIIVIHNHPSGHIDPSREDHAITDRLVEAGKMIGIPIVDHIIIGKGHYYSFKEQNAI